MLLIMATGFGLNGQQWLLAIVLPVLAWMTAWLDAPKDGETRDILAAGRAAGCAWRPRVHCCLSTLMS